MNRHRMTGFSLMEALITAVVLAIGVLGMAGLQGRALGTNHSSYLRSQAVIMAYDIMDRMRANRNIATTVSSAYERDYPDSVPSQVCTTTTTCSAAQMANADLKEWLESVQKLPDGAGAISVDINNDIATVSIRWDDTKSGNVSDYQVFTLTTKL